MSSIIPAARLDRIRMLVDERGIVYTMDRHVGGLYILEMEF